METADIITSEPIRNELAAEARKAALAPDKEKIQAFITEQKATKLPACKELEAKRMIMTFGGALRDLIADLETNFKQL